MEKTDVRSWRRPIKKALYLITASLPRKIILFMSLLLVFVLSVNLIFVFTQTKAIFLDNALKRTDTIIHNTEVISTSKDLKLQGYVSAIVKLESDIKTFDVYTLEANPSVVASLDLATIGKKANISGWSADQVSKATAALNGTDVVVIAPIHIGGTVANVAKISFSIEKELSQAVSQMLWKTVITGLVLLIASSVFMQFLFRSMITGPIQALVHTARQIAAGKLVFEADRRQSERADEIGELNRTFAEMAEQLRYIIGNVRLSANQVSQAVVRLSRNADATASAANQIAASIQEISVESETQLRNAQDNSKAMEEMATGIQRIAESSSLVSVASIEATDEVKNGNRSLQKTVQQMDIINAKVGEMDSAIRSLSEASAEINSIVTLIGEIASQTNLLALNAAIEAARAGEHGRGFAVVASEVRKLSEQTAVSAQQISSLISLVHKDTTASSHMMQSVNEEVRRGIQFVQEASLAFEKILTKITSVSEQIHEVSSASQQISAGTEQVSASMDEMTRSVKQSAAKAAQVADNTQAQQQSMEDIKELGNNLAVLVNNLTEAMHRFEV